MFRTRRNAIRVLFLAVGVLVVFGLYAIFNGEQNADEGFYLAASRLVSEGLRPYRDFGFTQGPLLPYVNVPWLEIFGYTLDGQRYSSLAWMVLTIVVGVWWLRSRGSWDAAAVFAVLLVGAPTWIAFAVKGKTYSFAGLCGLGGIIALSSDWRWHWRWLLFVAAAAAGIGTRYPMASFFVPAGLGLLTITPGWRARAYAVAFIVVSIGIFFALAAGHDWERFIYWTAQFHRESTFDFYLSKRVTDFLKYVPGLLLALILAWPAFRGARVRGIAGIALLVGAVANLAAPSSYAEYVMPLIPAAALLLAEVLVEAGTNWGVWRVAGSLGVVAALGWFFPPKLSPDLLLHAGQAENILRENVAAGSQVIASMPEIPIAAGMRIPTDLLMGKFALTEDYPPELAAQRLLVTPAKLMAYLRDPETKAVVWSSYMGWNFAWSVPSYRPLSSQAQLDIRAEVNKYFRFGYANDDFVIYLRKPSADKARR